MKILKILVAFLFFFMACKNAQDPQVKKLYDQVMAVHDEVMPKTKDIHDLKNIIKKNRAVMSDSVALPLLKSLDDADEGMMSWMHNFKNDPKAPVDQQLQYLTKEKQQIDEVASTMLANIDHVRRILDSLQIK